MNNFYFRTIKLSVMKCQTTCNLSLIKEYKKYIHAYSIASANHHIELSKDVESEIIGEKYKPRKHPGILKLRCVHLPDNLIDAVTEVVKDYPKKDLYEQASTLANYLNSRHPPAEGEEIKEKKNFIKDKLFIEGKLPSLHSDANLSEDLLPNEERRKFNKALSKHVYNWKPIEYDEYMSVAYLLARLAPDFACLVKIFEEIKKRNDNFKPKTFFDFGSGVGSGIWAFNQVWPDFCKEAYFVDSSPSMNNLAERLLKGGDPNGESIGPKSMFFRQFLPASSSLMYDVVLSSRSMCEVGDLKARAMTADILWRKVAPGGLLIFVENSTHPSYKMLMELRDFLLQMNESQSEENPNTPPMHVFSPCPHDTFCPRFFHVSGTTCHFEVKYQPPHLAMAKTAHFCYFVLQKAERPPERSWPRVVQAVLERHNHVIVRMCTPEGKLDSVVFTKKKHSKTCYNICKKSNWGDLLPVKLLPTEEESEGDDAAEAEEEKQTLISSSHENAMPDITEDSNR